MSNVPPAPSRTRVALRLIITLVLIAIIVVVLVFALSRPVSAPGENTPANSNLIEIIVTMEPIPPGADQTLIPETEESSPKRQTSGGASGGSLATLTGDILFMSNHDGDYDIYAENLIAFSAAAAASAADSVPINLTQNDTGDGFASYSFDRVQISYINQGETELGGYLMNADGTNQIPAAADVGTFINILLAGRGDWDGREHASGARSIISLRDLNLEVYYQAAGETSQRNLSQNGAIDWYAQLSPDGTRLVFATDRNDGQQDIYVIDVTGENLTRLTDDPADDWSPMWLDDGSGVVFASERGGRFDGGTLGVYVAYLGTALPDAIRVDQTETFTTAPIWQAGYGLFMSNETGDWEIYVTDAAGNVVNVTSDPADDLFAVWKPA